MIYHTYNITYCGHNLIKYYYIFLRLTYICEESNMKFNNTLNYTIHKVK